MPIIVTRLVRLTAAAGLAIASGATLTACQTTGYEQASLTSQRLSDTRLELYAAKPVLKDATSNLNALIDEEQPSLVPQYRRFANSVDELEEQEQDIRDSTAAMRTRHAAYVQNWERDLETISDAELRQQAQDRLTKTRSEFDTLDDEIADVRDRFSALVSNLRDVQRILANDLTARGLDAIKSTASEINDEEQAVQEAIDTLIARMDDMSAQLSAAAVAPRDR